MFVLANNMGFFSENIIEDRENLSDFLEEAELQQYYELFR